MALKLTVPTTQINNAPLLRLKSAERWLASLPPTSASDSARSVGDMLAQLNRRILDADERFAVLETYAPVLLRLRASLTEEYHGVHLPLPQNARQAVNLARELLIEEAYGYKLVLLEKTSVRLDAGKELVPLIQRLMSALSELLTLSYRSYIPTPAGVWNELHQIYGYATRHGLGGEASTPGTQSTDNLYKQALLLALADPYRLPGKDLDAVQPYVREYASLVRIDHEFKGTAGPHLFVVNADSDKPPIAASHFAPETLSGNLWLLDASPVVARLDARAAQLDADRRDAEGAELMRRLAKLWGAPPKRAFKRSAANARIDICSGLRSIGHYLSMDANRSGASPADASADFPLSEWEIVNQSAGGLKLAGLPREIHIINVGEVIGLRYRGMPGTSIAVVRWVQSFDAGGLEFGVQMLAPRGEVVSVQPISAGHASIQDALLLPELAALQRPASLLTPAGVYAEEREYQVCKRATRFGVRASELMEKTTSFELFRFVAA